MTCASNTAKTNSAQLRSLNSIIAHVFDIDLDSIKLELNPRTDIQMSNHQQSELTAMIAEDFDDLQVDFSCSKTLGDLFDLVIEQESKMFLPTHSRLCRHFLRIKQISHPKIGCEIKNYANN